MEDLIIKGVTYRAYQQVYYPCCGCCFYLDGDCIRVQGDTHCEGEVYFKPLKKLVENSPIQSNDMDLSIYMKGLGSKQEYHDFRNLVDRLNKLKPGICLIGFGVAINCYTLRLANYGELLTLSNQAMAILMDFTSRGFTIKLEIKKDSLLITYTKITI